jgi:hypothetical protein
VSEQSSQCLLTGPKREDSILVRLDAVTPQNPSGGMVDRVWCVPSGGEDEPRSTRTEPSVSVVATPAEGSGGLALGGIAR